jgi:hypothetical protein
LVSDEIRLDTARAVYTLAVLVIGSRERGRGRWRIWAASLALLLAMALPAARVRAATSVAVGDSITYMSTDEILNRFSAAGWSGGVAAISGYRIDQMRPYIQYVAAGVPNLRRMFIYLGTNDAAQYSGVDARLTRAIGHLHAAVHDVIDVRPKACVFLVTLRDFNYNTPDYHHAVVTLNREMKTVIDPAFSRVYVIDWNAISNGKDWFTDDFLGIIGHLNQTGQYALADNYRFFGNLVDTESRPCGPTPVGVR